MVKTYLHIYIKKNSYEFLITILRLRVERRLPEVSSSGSQSIVTVPSADSQSFKFCGLCRVVVSEAAGLVIVLTGPKRISNHIERARADGWCSTLVEC